MKKTITEALIYESQGLKTEALEIYKEILLHNPKNTDALEAINRLSGLKKITLNKTMKDFFVNMKSEEEIKEFKRWLVKL